MSSATAAYLRSTVSGKSSPRRVHWWMRGALRSVGIFTSYGSSYLWGVHRSSIREDVSWRIHWWRNFWWVFTLNRLHSIIPCFFNMTVGYTRLASWTSNKAKFTFRDFERKPLLKLFYSFSRLELMEIASNYLCLGWFRSVGMRFARIGRGTAVKIRLGGCVGDKWHNTIGYTRMKQVSRRAEKFNIRKKKP